MLTFFALPASGTEALMPLAGIRTHLPEASYRRPWNGQRAWPSTKSPSARDAPLCARLS